MKNGLFKGILALMMTLMVFTGVTFAAAPLQDGQYTISVDAVNASNGSPSMANDSIVKPVRLDVEKGKIFVTMEMADSMYDLAAETADGSFKVAEEVSENVAAKTITYKFEVKSIDEPVMMETIVAAMGRKVNFVLQFNKGSVVNVTPQGSTASNTTPANTTSTNTTTTNTTNTTTTNTSTNVENPKTGDQVLSNLMNVILVALVMTGATYGVYHIKGKKVTN
ncbi:NEAT domain-containing protein [Alkaliphilus transvaalensis]|uniref:NEAT domain-containing protein n=1 Tax=Alkaliphilus transvaalensis TaxID=114628 RepID=UPI00047D1602|nr:NEAT domain-containing protein [Alkaliphilus transvaalensis]